MSLESWSTRAPGVAGKTLYMRNKERPTIAMIDIIIRGGSYLTIHEGGFLWVRQRGWGKALRKKDASEPCKNIYPWIKDQDSYKRWLWAVETQLCFPPDLEVNAAVNFDIRQGRARLESKVRWHFVRAINVTYYWQSLDKVLPYTQVSVLSRWSWASARKSRPLLREVCIRCKMQWRDVDSEVNHQLNITCIVKTIVLTTISRTLFSKVSAPIVSFW